MGPDKFSSLTTTSYSVKSLQANRFFYTDDVVQPPNDAPSDALDEAPAIYVEERGEQSAEPAWAKLRCKQSGRCGTSGGMGCKCATK